MFWLRCIPSLEIPLKTSNSSIEFIVVSMDLVYFLLIPQLYINTLNLPMEFITMQIFSASFPSYDRSIYTSAA